MKRSNGKSILRRYLISFVSIAMLSCAVVGLITYLTAVQELRISAQAEQQKRLTLAVEDMDDQLEILQDIANRVQTSIYYMPMYISRNPYYEVELLDDLEKFSNYSSLLSHYFIRYEGQDAVFSDMGKSYLGVYTATRFGLFDSASLAAFLDACTTLNIYPVQNGVLAVFPIKMNAAQSYSGRATLCFHITDSALINRLQLVSGEKFERVSLACGDRLVVAHGNIASPLTVASDRFSLTVDIEEIGSGIDERFTQLSVLLIGVLLVLLCVLAAAVAVRNYRPIGTIAKRHNLAVGEGNELELIDRELVTVKGKLQLSQDELEERVAQFKTVRTNLLRHFVLQVVHGYADEKAITRMREAGVHFPAEAFQVFLLHAGENTQNVEQTVCELSGDDAFFHAVPYGGENSYAVLASTPAGVKADEILREVCTDAEVYGGRKTEVPGEVSGLLFDALAQAAPSCIRPSDIARCREDKRLHALRKALETGDENEALRSMREYCEAYAQGDQTLQQLIRNNVISVLLSASYDVNLTIPHAFLRGDSHSWSMLESWVGALCNNCKTISAHEEHEIIRYLREHALDYSLSLESVAEHFRRSTRQISRIIQAETGAGYKEFTLRLRMEYAKDMLQAGKSVEETSKAVCYASRSHFIKTFASYTGMTPSRFRDQTDKENEE